MSPNVLMECPHERMMVVGLGEGSKEHGKVNITNSLDSVQPERDARMEIAMLSNMDPDAGQPGGREDGGESVLYFIHLVLVHFSHLSLIFH